jgi:anti-sigma factor RsiW
MTYRELRCEQLVELVTDYLEGALDPQECEHIERHLVYCRGCAAYLDQMRKTIRLTGRLRADDMSPEMMDSLLAAFKMEHPT